MEPAKNETFADLVEKCGLGLSDVAERTGYTVRTLYRWKSGQIRPRKSVIEWLRRQSETNNRLQPTVRPRFRFIDLFAGIGGLRLGFDAVGGRCVFTSEWDKASRKTYQANFACDHPIEGDITKIPEEDIPPHDVLLAGFPCQPFSIAGVSKKNALGDPHGFRCEAQGNLFFDAARIIGFHRPAAFLLENVKNLAGHDKGNTFRVIRDTLENELGYNIDFRVINAKAFLPQNRERIFIAGFGRDVGFDFKELNVPDVKDGPKMKTILHPEDGSEPEEPPYTIGPDAKVNPKYTLSGKLWNYLKGYAAKHRARGNGFGYGLVGPDDVARTLSARYYKDGSEILVKQPHKRPRRLTPRECARLMGFDISAESRFEIPVSDTQAYRQFGNSVAVPVVNEVAGLMRPFIQLAMHGNYNRQLELFEMPEERERVAQHG